MKRPTPKRRSRRVPRDEIQDMDDLPATTGRPRRVADGLRSANATVNVSIIYMELVRRLALEKLGCVANSNLTRDEALQARDKALKARGGQKALVNAALEIIDPSEKNWPDSACEAVRQWVINPTRSAMPTRERLLGSSASKENKGTSET